MAKRILTAILLFGCVVSLSAQNFPIGQRTYSLQDPNRGNRSVPTEIFYPAVSAGQNEAVASGFFPVIVFGHGFAMNYDSYSNLWNELVPRGYILVFPKTETSVLPPPSHGDFADDLRFLKQQMEAWNSNAGNPFFQKQSGRYAYAGHSMGGGASVIAASKDSTISALFNLAAAETNPSAIQAARLTNAVPALIMAGSSDCVASPGGNQIPIFDSLNSSCKHFVSITDGMHCRFAVSNTLCDGAEFTCQPIPSITRSNQHDIMFDVLNPWLDFFLKGDCSRWNAFENQINTNPNISSRAECDYQPLEPEISYYPDTIQCRGDSVYLVRVGQIDSIIWFNGISGVDTMAVGESGNYSYVATDRFNCATTSPKVNVTILELPNPVVILNNDTFLCPGDSVRAAVNRPFQSYLWTNGDTTISTWIKDSIDLAVFVTNQLGCSNWSDTQRFVKATAEARPILSVSGDTLRVNSGNSFQWYRDSILLIGENNNFTVVDSPGIYYVDVVKENNCPDRSDSFELIVDAIPELSGIPGLTIGPNPAQSQLSVSAGLEVELVLFTLSGKLILKTESSSHHKIDLGGLAKGFYLIKVTDQEGREVTFKQMVE